MPADDLSAAFAALADPTRRAILARLASGEATVQQVAAPFAISAPAISRHLRVLEGARLIHRKKDGQWRRCTLSDEGFRTAAEFIERYRRFWEDRFDGLERYLERVRDNETGMTRKSKPKATKGGSHAKRGSRNKESKS